VLRLMTVIRMTNPMTTLAEWRTRAALALRDGRIEDGITAYRAVVAAGQADAESWYNLGYLLRCDRRFDEALAAYGAALAAGIDRPEEVHLNRAVILSEYCGRIDDAVTELRAALALAPSFVAAWLNLGNLHEDAGDAAAAREAYAQVLALDPGNGRAHARIATIDVFEKRADAAIPALRQALARPGLSPADAAEPGFALGAALDAQGHYDEAFEAFAAANRAALKAAHPSYRYDPQRQQAMIDATIAATPRPAPAGSEDAESPIFICGMFRSGSTLIEQMLSRHPRITKGGELEIVPAFAAALGSPAALLDLPAETLATLRARYRDEVRRQFGDVDRLTDKRPDNFLHIGLIKRLFPDAKIINTIRNPLDMALSIYFLYFDDSISYGHDLRHIAHWVGQYRRLMAHWRSLYPQDILDVSYDRLVADPGPVMAEVLAFCDLPWDDGVLHPEQADGPVRTASVWQVRQRLHRRSSGRWRHYERHLQPLIATLGSDA
jgi:tetratricopeptide (TPR) repeat protein